MDCFYYVTDVTNPYRNLALEECFLRRMQPNQILLYLWQNDNTVVLGRNQNAWRECRFEAFTAQEGYLARRLTGGGAVYHDLGNQNFSILADKRIYDVSRQTELICRAVQSFGIAVQQSGRNDILAEGRKFSGNAYYQTGRSALQHGTILISSDLTRLSRFLAPSPEKLASKGVKSVSERVINLCELNPEITPEKMRQALLDAFAEVYGTKPMLLSEETIDHPFWNQLTQHYAAEEWRLGRHSSFAISLRHRFSFGELEFLLQVEQGVIQAVQICSDAMDTNWVEALEQRLQGQSYSNAAMAAALPSGEHRNEVAAYLLNCEL